MNYKHGLSKHSLYDVWNAMKQRCYNKNCMTYDNYGGRGIKVCKEWFISPKNFIEWAIKNGYKKGLDIDRIDNNGNYCSENCRFVSRSKNIKNRRAFSKDKIKYVYRIGNKYRVRKKIDGKDKHYGVFVTLEEAKSVAEKLID